MQRSRWISALAAAVLVLLPLLATAQEGPTPLTWVGMMKVKPGADLQFEKAFETYDRPILDQLVADGRASSWALGYELAGPGGFDYVFWINASDWAGIGEIESAFNARYEGMSEEELADMIGDWAAAIEPGADQTQLLRHLIVKANPDADNTYLRLSYHTVKAGYGSDLMKMYRSYWVPIYDHLLEAGVIGAYGVIEQAVHSDTSFTHLAWFEFNSLADLDKVEKALEEADAEVSEGDAVARKLAFMKMVETDAHYCRLIRVWKHGG